VKSEKDLPPLPPCQEGDAQRTLQSPSRQDGEVGFTSEAESPFWQGGSRKRSFGELALAASLAVLVALPLFDILFRTVFHTGISGSASFDRLSYRHFRQRVVPRTHDSDRGNARRRDRSAGKPVAGSLDAR
jgi:hypothetical protein